MPDFSSVFNSSASPSSHCSKSSSSLYPNSVASKPQHEHNGRYCSWDRKVRYQKAGVGFKVLRRDQKRLVRRGAFDRSNKLAVGKSLEDHVRAWLDKKLESGVPERECFLPFLVGAPKSADCHMCGKVICSGEEVVCSVRSCQEAYHLVCVKGSLEFSTLRSFKCPQHACFVCKQKGFWRCTRCTVASHSKCAPWQDKVIYLTNQPGRAVCWRHPTNWRLEKKQHAVPTSDIEEIFCHLPLPYVEEDFKIDFMWKDMMESKLQPAPYVHIKRNVYLVKKKRDDLDAGIGCTNCSATICSEACVCRVQSISCSKSCHCSDMCTNRPFRKEKKVKVVKTQYCGWGVEAAESIKKGDFIIEYIGEVIDDALCEQRLWDIKYRGDQNFYMCEIRKDFTIDATFKGNAARFLNHSCDPNCKLEKWQVDGKTCVGIFAARPIKAGETLAYDYRFVHFGPKVKCFCGSSNCQGYLGFKRKTDNMDICWGCKRRRSSMSCVKV